MIDRQLNAVKEIRKEELCDASLGNRRRSLKAQPSVKASQWVKQQIFTRKNKHSFPSSSWSEFGQCLFTLRLYGPFPWRRRQAPQGIGKKRRHFLNGWFDVERLCASVVSWVKLAIDCRVSVRPPGGAAVSVAWWWRHFVKMLWGGIQLRYVIRMGFCLTSRMSATQTKSRAENLSAVRKQLQLLEPNTVLLIRGKIFMAEILVTFCNILQVSEYQKQWVLSNV